MCLAFFCIYLAMFIKLQKKSIIGILGGSISYESQKIKVLLSKLEALYLLLGGYWSVINISAYAHASSGCLSLYVYTQM